MQSLEYYYLIQDFLGILVMAFSLRAVYFFVRCLLKFGFERRRFLNVFIYGILLISGGNLVIQNAGINAWAISGGLVVAFFMLNRWNNRCE